MYVTERSGVVITSAAFTEGSCLADIRPGFLEIIRLIINTISEVKF